MILQSPSMEPALLPLLLLPLLVLPAEADYCDLAQQHTLCANKVRSCDQSVVSVIPAQHSYCHFMSSRVLASPATVLC